MNDGIAGILLEEVKDSLSVTDVDVKVRKTPCLGLQTTKVPPRVALLAKKVHAHVVVEAIGGIGFSIGNDVHRFTAELGYWLAEPFWNQGIVTRAVVAVTDYAFEAFGLHRISATPYESSRASIRVLEKSGFEREGMLKASAFKNGQVINQVVYAKIRLPEKSQ